MNIINGMVVNRTLMGTSYNPREPINHINVATIIILGTIIPQPDLNAINRKIISDDAIYESLIHRLKLSRTKAQHTSCLNNIVALLFFLQLLLYQN